MQAKTERPGCAAPGSHTSGPYRAILSDNALARARFLATFPCLAARQVAELTGHQREDGSVLVEQWRQTRQILSNPGERQELYPAFQLRDGAPHPAMARILAALPARQSPWQIIPWLVASCSWFDGASPASRLDDEEAVVEAARREAQEIVG
jgi:hypothetical protein